MRSRTILVSLTALFILLFVRSVLRGKSFTINFEKGKVYKYSTIVESKTSGQSMGQEFTMTSGADFDYSISLISANDAVSDVD